MHRTEFGIKINTYSRTIPGVVRKPNIKRGEQRNCCQRLFSNYRARYSDA